MNAKIIALLLVCSLAALSSVTEAQKQNICRLARVVGPCKNFVTCWWYDTQDRQCKSFQFGGCNGNENNFPTKGACEAACVQ